MKKCLIVDDQEQNRYLLETLLRGSGYQTETASNGEEALILARATPPDIMITDVLMPVMDGFTLCKEWKQDERLKSIPVVIYTATYTEAKDEAFALALGADRFLVKPQEPEILVEELKIIFRKTEEGSFSPAAKSITEEESFIARHYEAVIRKLEEKVTELQQAQDDLNREMVERKKLQATLEKERETLKASEAKFRFLTEKMTDVIWTVDLNLKTQYISPSVEKNLGFTPEERMGQDFFEQVTTETYSRLMDVYQQEMEKELSEKSDPARIISVEMEYLHKNGNTVWMESLLCGIRDVSGKLIGIHGVSRNISKRKQAEEALRKSESRLKILSNNLPSVMIYQVIVSDNGTRRLTFLSDSVRQLYGVSPEEAMADAALIYNRIHEDDLPLLVKTENEAIKTLSTFRAEARVRDPSGSIRWSSFASTPTRLDDGTTRWDGIEVVITESKRVENNLRESESKLLSILSAAPVGICLMKNRVYQSANSFWCEKFGYAEQSLIGKDTRMMYESEEEFERVGQLLYTNLMKNGSHSIETRLRRSNGTVRSVIITAAPLCPDDLTAGTVAIIEDITERKLAEEKQRESELLFTAFMNNLPASVLIKDNELRPIYANKRFKELFPAEAWMEKTPAETFPSEIASPMIENDRQAIDKGFVRYEEQWKTVDDLICIFETSKFRIERDGKTPFLGCIILDVTDLRHAENERKEFAQRLSRAEKMEALGMLAGGVAHDLNNVLGIMVGYSEMLLDDFDKTSPMRSRMLHIKDASERAAAIVQDLLTLARRGIQNRTAVNLNTIIMAYQRTPEFEKLSAFHPNVRIKTDYDANLLNIMGSQAHLEKTMMNLVSNAAEAMPHGGLLTITTDNQYLEHPVHGYDEVKEGDYAVIQVSDTGEGISAKDINRIFEPFYTKKVMGRSGTGLGLAVVWGTVKDHNGYIDVQSELGKGTTFTLYFPVTREEIISEKKSVALAEYMGHGESILVVDDVPGQRELAAVMLGKLNYVVHTVASGEEALAYIKTHQVDLIILDMIMDPGIDGLETYQRILDISPGQKAIIVSGFSETDRVRSAQQLGAGAYVRKPYVLEKLGLTIRNELYKR